MAKGLVIKNTGSWYTVLTDDGQLLDCKVKGNFRIKGIRSTNPVAVGDRVTVNDECWITEIEDRKNYIIRKSINLSKQSHILAANVDQALLIVTVSKPETSTTFIDRFLASAEAYRVPVILIFNKVDLLSDDELHYQQMMINLYETIGYECRAISATTGVGVEELRPLLEGKITLLSGNSGVGKSTLINRLVPHANQRVADISEAHQTGMHTTTFSEMIPLTTNLSQLTSFLWDFSFRNLFTKPSGCGIMGVPLSEGSFLCVPPLRSSRGPLPLQREVQDLTGPDLRTCFRSPAAQKFSRRCRYESEDYPCLHRMQTAQLRHEEEQEERPRPSRTQEVLPVLPQAYSPQRNEVIVKEQENG